jgi:ABC-2 type transport system ATP-binding protein
MQISQQYPGVTIVPTVRLSNLTKYYGSSLGVEDVNLDVAPGTVCGLLGPNGSGKTTILRMILGLLRITRGTATVFGLDIAAARPTWRSRVGYLPGELSLYENQTVERYLAYLSALRRGNFSVRIAELCDRLSLDPRKHIDDLSKGTKQKVAVVQAFMHSPDLLILDEPTSGLDPIIQHEFEKLIHEECSRGAAIILSSHVMSEAERLSTHVSIVNKGRLVLTDDIASLKAKVTRSVELEFDHMVDPDLFRSTPNVQSVRMDRNIVTCRIVGSENALLRIAAAAGVVTVRTHEQSLDQIFLDVVRDHA